MTHYAKSCRWAAVGSLIMHAYMHNQCPVASFTSCRRDEEWPLCHAGERRVREGWEERRQECGDHRLCAGYRWTDPQGKNTAAVILLKCYLPFVLSMNLSPISTYCAFNVQENIIFFIMQHLCKPSVYVLAQQWLKKNSLSPIWHLKVKTVTLNATLMSLVESCFSLTVGVLFWSNTLHLNIADPDESEVSLQCVAHFWCSALTACLCGFLRCFGLEQKIDSNITLLPLLLLPLPPQQHATL